MNPHLTGGYRGRVGEGAAVGGVERLHGAAVGRGDVAGAARPGLAAGGEAYPATAAAAAPGGGSRHDADAADADAGDAAGAHRDRARRRQRREDLHRTGGDGRRAVLRDAL